MNLMLIRAYGSLLARCVILIVSLQEVQKHSVHTLVFRSLKRTHDMFVADNGKPVPLDEER